jgi:hypothetical protein
VAVAVAVVAVMAADSAVAVAVATVVAATAVAMAVGLVGLAGRADPLIVNFFTSFSLNFPLSPSPSPPDGGEGSFEQPYVAAQWRSPLACRWSVWI